MNQQYPPQYPQGHPPQGHPPQAHPPGYYGVPPQGHPPQGHPPGYYGVPPQGHPPQGGTGINVGRIVAGVIAGLVILGVAVFFLVELGGGRGGGSAPGSPVFAPLRETVVINDHSPYKDGAGSTWKVEPGTYRVEMTATSDGASVEWVGASCMKAEKTTVYNTTCTVTQTSQLTIRNPTLLGLGSDVIVTLKVTRLP